MNNRRRKLAVALATVMVVGSGCSRGDAAAGAPEAVTCLACHGGESRATSPHIPRIAGQSEIYLARQLRAYRDGSREDPVMSPLARSLADQEIDDLAAYFSTLEDWGSP